MDVFVAFSDVSKHKPAAGLTKSFLRAVTESC